MNSQLHDAWRTLVPGKGDPHGPLPPLLVLLTIVTGLVDAFSYLELGRVFVANMTGNVVFLAFALGGAPGFVWWASILGVVTFLIGAFVGGRIGAVHGFHRGRHLLVASATQAGLVILGLVGSLVFSAPYGDAALVVMIVLLGVGMGLQNAAARALSVPDLTTTVLTLTLTGISADSRAAGGSNSRIGRRLLSIASMFLGGLIGALLIEKADAGPVALAIAAALLLVVVGLSARASRSGEEWAKKR